MIRAHDTDSDNDSDFYWPKVDDRRENVLGVKYSGV